MTEPFFFDRGRGLTVREIASLTGAEPRSGTDLDRRITGVASLDRAAPSELAFLDKPKYADQLAGSSAGACLMTERHAGGAPAHICVLSVREPYRAFVEVTRRLFPDALRPSSLFEAGGVSVGARVHPSARMESAVTVDPGAVIGPQAEIGSGTVIGANAVIGPKVRIGRRCVIGANTSITNSLLGDRVIVHPGCAIGQDGFGYVMAATGHAKVPQVGRVIIQDDVEIGALTSIDRGGLSDTVIGEGTKIDNLVQVGHNTTIGRHCVVVAQTGISGSVTIEDFVVLAARVGVHDHVTIREGAQIAAAGVIWSEVPAGARLGGWPAKPVRQWMREIATLARLAGSERRPAAGRDEE
ncbi:MAG: UDP-3-O-[3-hydroxymyristoyl] glucosamine N-acyltransferase [Alphaproteobacteria bacterium]|nr:UDP-3-O-[3-hydroxymyristoyl] glucosamine N-acyltransferase [Alphaproteobacteria bacterium]